MTHLQRIDTNNAGGQNHYFFFATGQLQVLQLTTGANVHNTTVKVQLIERQVNISQSLIRNSFPQIHVDLIDSSSG